MNLELVSDSVFKMCENRNLPVAVGVTLRTEVLRRLTSLFCSLEGYTIFQSKTAPDGLTTTKPSQRLILFR